MTEEIWKDIKGFEGLYQVSTFGNVKSLDRYVKHNTRGGIQHIKGRILTLTGGAKYIQVILCRGGVTKPCLVHRLVAEAFIPNPNNLPCVNHKDENPKNNSVDNLEWCTYQYNNCYNYRVEKCKHKISETLRTKSYHHKMTLEQIEHIRLGAYRGWETRRAKIKSAIVDEEEV